MTKEQYELLKEALEEDLIAIDERYAEGFLNGEHADYETRRVYEELEELERDWNEQQNC